MENKPLVLTFSIDEDKLRQIVAEAVENLIAQGYIWREEVEEDELLD